VSGTVVATGKRVTRWRPGDRVFGLVGGGGLASRVLVEQATVTCVPANLGEPEAAAIPEAFVTADDAVRVQAGLGTGEVLLVHGAAGGVGSAAVQLGLTAGARVFGVSRSERGLDFVRELGAEALDDSDFVEEMLARTEGRGADVILELVGAVHFPGNLQAIAEGGRLVVVGVGAGHVVELSLSDLMGKRAIIHGTVLRSRSLGQKSMAVEGFGRAVVPHLATGRVRAVIDKIFPAEAAAEAFDYLTSRGKRGKVLLDFGAPRRFPLRLAPEETG
jgi:NADPH:quinone reductase-like Zn-dependent oxidoreductase